MSTLLSNMPHMLDIQHKIKTLHSNKITISWKLENYSEDTDPKQLISLHIVNHTQNSLVLVCVEEAGVPVSFISLFFK